MQIQQLPAWHFQLVLAFGWVELEGLLLPPRSTLHEQAAEANVYNSPGWRRLQARSAERPVSQPRETRNTVIDLTAVSAFTVGERVFHQKFGYGAVIGIEGDKLEIDFEKAGVKKVVARFVSAENDVPF